MVMMVAACSAQAEPSPTVAAGRATAQPASTSATRQPTTTPSATVESTRQPLDAMLPTELGGVNLHTFPVGRDSLERLASRFGLHLAVGTYYAFSLDDTLLVVRAFDPEAATEAVGALSR